MDAARSSYRETPPPQELADRFVCLWEQTISGDGIFRQPVLPDGCVDIVWIGQAPPIVAGPATHRIVVALPAGTDLVGARFRPGWASESLGMSVAQILNQDACLDDVWKKGAALLGEPMCGSPARKTRLEAVRRSLTSLFADVPAVDAGVRQAVRWLVDFPSGEVGALARALGSSERHLRRRFRHAVGYSPKTFQRIMRLQRLLALSGALSGSGGSAAAAAAVGAGFADQAHMCREVRALTGNSPGALFRRKAESTVSDLFNTDAMGGDYAEESETGALEGDDSWIRESA